MGENETQPPTEEMVNPEQAVFDIHDHLTTKPAIEERLEAEFAQDHATIAINLILAMGLAGHSLGEGRSQPGDGLSLELQRDYPLLLRKTMAAGQQRANGYGSYCSPYHSVFDWLSQRCDWSKPEPFLRDLAVAAAVAEDLSAGADVNSAEEKGIFRSVNRLTVKSSRLLFKEMVRPYWKQGETLPVSAFQADILKNICREGYWPVSEEHRLLAMEFDTYAAEIALREYIVAKGSNHKPD